ncbi:tyrosine-type recombinase/integrase [Burkholderia lata]|uniref:tyrosine-type recombinase/integrase n=1 Tax=Burkholderia lata (strain ATCC 17760 / DSM 23089 / LMG 22485 / NCIMB 9086 / R18194 / 383) TaxID=482957 RepID=UPI00399A7349
MVEQLLDKMTDPTEPERRRLAGPSPHAFRHTFGTQSVAADVPPNVQQLLAHASLQTTSVYVTVHGSAAGPKSRNTVRALRRHDSGTPATLGNVGGER